MVRVVNTHPTEKNCGGSTTVSNEDDCNSEEVLEKNDNSHDSSVNDSSMTTSNKSETTGIQSFEISKCEQQKKYPNIGKIFHSKKVA